MRLQPSLLILLAPLWASATPIQEQAPTAPEARGGVSGSIPESDSRARADQPPDPAGNFARPAYKSEGMAIALSVLGTAIPVLVGNRMSGGGDLAGSLMVGGMVLGPSLGQFYAGSLGRGMLGTGIRTVGAVMVLQGTVYILDNLFCEEGEGNGCNESEVDAATPLLIFGTATYLGGAIYSLLDAAWAVKRYNSRLDDKRGFGWSPTLAPAPLGGLKPGVLAWMRF